MSDFALSDCKSKEDIGTIINLCDYVMGANDVLTVYGFGKDNNLALRIVKDPDYKIADDTDEKQYNLVSFTTFLLFDGGVNSPVDDVTDVHISDGSLERELLRVFEKKDLSLLD